MCLGSIAVLAEAWDDDGVPVGRLDDGCVVSLSFVPDAEPGAHLLLHLGIPVEVLDPETARDALELRARRESDDDARAPPASRSRSSTAVISGVSIYVNGHAVRHFGDATVYTTAKNVVAGVLLLALALAVPARRSARRDTRTAGARQWLAFFAVGVIGGSVPFVLFFEGLARAEATQAVVHPEDARHLGRASRRPAPARALRRAARCSRSCC